MPRVKKILLWCTGLLAVLVAAFVTIIGPWPVYSSTNFENSGYYSQALKDIEASAHECAVSATPGPLKAGWAAREIRPPAGTPLAGYGDRKGRPSTGIHDPLHAKALALSDGTDTVVLLGVDMLLIPPNAAELTQKLVSEKTPLTSNDILYHASHTHCGPGGFLKGLIAKTASGAYQEDIPPLLAEAFAGAIVEAYEQMKPAKLGHGTTDAAHLIRNRTREAGVDSVLNVALIEQEGGKRCYLTRFSAHPTLYGGGMMQFSAEYPGALMRSIEKETGGAAIYLGGAVGSMSTRAPEGFEGDAKVEAMGQALARLALDKAATLTLEESADVASLSVTVGMPSPQMRPVSQKWRLSPFFSRIAGMDGKGRIQVARAGTMMWTGASFDFSGEVSVAWRNWAHEHQCDLWVTSFAPGYCGYLSPDRYYYETDKDDGGMGYEIGLMNWYGPNTEAYFTALFEHAAQSLLPAIQSAAASP